MTDASGSYPPFDVPWAADEERAIRETVDDYFQSWFTADSDRMRRGIHPSLAKYGLWRSPEMASTPWEGSRVTFDDMVRWTAEGRGAGLAPEDRAYGVRVIEVHDRVAVAVVHSVEYMEYLHLLRTPDGWRVINSLWQTPS